MPLDGVTGLNGRCRVASLTLPDFRGQSAAMPALAHVKDRESLRLHAGGDGGPSPLCRFKTSRVASDLVFMRSATPRGSTRLS